MGLTEYLPGQPTVVWLEGELDAPSVSDLADAMSRAVALDHSDLVVDLGRVEFASAAAVSVFIRSRDFLEHRSRSLTIRAANPEVRGVLTAGGLADLITP